MSVEMDGIALKKVWSLSDLPRGFKEIWTKWILEKKLHPDSYVNQLKASLIADGFSQKSEMDYGDVYAPVVRYSTQKMMLSAEVQQYWKILQLNVRAALLIGPLRKELFIEQPEGFIQR